MKAAFSLFRSVFFFKTGKQKFPSQRRVPDPFQQVGSHLQTDLSKKKMEGAKGPVCVVGATGYIGSWLVMRLLEQGYTVRAAVRDTSNITKTKHLLDLPNSRERLTLWNADLDNEGSFDEVINGCTGVFHVATPSHFESQDPENDAIKPTVNGVLNILRSCSKAKSIRRVVFTSSTITVNIGEHRKPEYNETCWTDIDFCRRTKMNGWINFVSKTMAEKAACDFAVENNIDFISIIPTLVVGPFITPSMPPGMNIALALITGNEAYYSILKQIQMIHVDDLCLAHIFLFEHPKAEGRYICSSVDTTIVELAKMLKDRYPEYDIPTKFNGMDDSIEAVRFSSKKLTELGFKFQFSMEDMFDGAIKCCREKGLLPVKFEVKE